jgi:predicted lipoprotein with Yx(FWY)xxD motif
MTRSVRPIKLLAGAVLLTLAPLATAACGGGGATASMKPPKAATAATTTVGVATSGLGRILVDSQGRTLYLFKKDSGTTSACTGACASAWPPLLVKGKPEAVSGASASLLGTTTRPEGTSQVTYNGHPLYLFVKDQKPGDTNGQGLTAFGAAWFAVTPAGAQVGQRPSATGGSPARKPAVSPAPEPKPTPEPAAPKPAPEPAAPKPAPQRAAPPAPKPAPPAESGIPQNNGGDGDADNNGGPSDGDGAI